MNFKKQIFAMAKQDPKTLVFPEASFSDSVMSAIKILTSKHLAKVILLGDPNVLFVKYNSFENDFLKIINPKESELKQEVMQKIYELRFRDGITQEQAQQLAEDPYYFGTTLLLLDYADGLVSGSESITSTTYRPSLDMLAGNSKKDFVASGVLYIGKNKVLKNRPILLADYSLNENPTENELVLTAKNCVDFWKMLFIQEPKVAFLSYSSNGSAKGASPEKMKNATEIFKQSFQDVVCEGEMQLDCAIMPRCQEKKFPNSKIKGDANILIVPDNNCGNCLGKAIQYFGNLQRIGPIGFSFAKPVSDVSRVATVEEIVMTSVITAIQAQV